MFKHSLSRRMFLQGAGGAFLTLPFLPSLIPNVLRADDTAPLPRYVYINIPYGPAFPKNWYPSRSLLTKSTLFPTASLDGWWVSPHSHDIVSGGIPFSSENGISNLFDKKFNSLASKMTFIQGLDLPAGSHYQACLLGNLRRADKTTKDEDSKYTDMPTIDHIMAYAPNFYPSTPGIIRQLNISPLRDQQHGQGMSFRFQNKMARNGAVILDEHMYDAKKIFDFLFGTFVAPTTVKSNTPLIDAIKADYKSIRNGRAISSSDKLLLDSHIAEIADLEKMTSTLACSAPASPDGLSGKSINGAQQEPYVKEMFLAYNRLIVAAFRCQLTRVINLDLHYHTGGPGLHIHDDQVNYDQLPNLHKDAVDTVVFDLVNRLNSELDPGGGTILDNSLVHLTASSGPIEHASYGMPNLLFGSAGGKIKTGQYLDYADQVTRDATTGRPYGLLQNQLNVSIMQAMGLTPDDYNMAKLGVLGPSYDPVTTTTYGETTIYNAYNNVTENRYYENAKSIAGEFLPFLKA